jgi:hypothetical protein
MKNIEALIDDGGEITRPIAAIRLRRDCSR